MKLSGYNKVAAIEIAGKDYYYALYDEDIKAEDKVLVTGRLATDILTVKNVFGTVNKVYYKDVKYSYVKRLPVFTRDKGIPCLLFNDGRKECSFFTGNNIDNHKKYIVRIPYTQEVVDYLKINNIKLNNNSIFKSMINE